VLPSGPGSFFLPNPTTGLDQLAAYHATLTVSFAGTRDGAPETWSRNYSMVAVNQPVARQLTVTSSSEPANDAPDPPTQTEAGRVLFEAGNDGSCLAKTLGPDVLSLAESERAGLLPAVLGAVETGDETVAGMTTKHYQFDEKALALGDGRAYNGELWAAVDGGFIVRYLLSSTAGPELSGQVVEGTMTWDYTLADINAPITVDVPTSCPSQLDAPVMPGAERIVAAVGSVSFELPSATIDEVLAFYTEALATNGWTANAEPLVESNRLGTTTLLKDASQISVIAYAEDGVTNVSVRLDHATTG
jgi:hypothetical protein